MWDCYANIYKHFLCQINKIEIIYEQFFTKSPLNAYSLRHYQAKANLWILILKYLNQLFNLVDTHC